MQRCLQRQTRFNALKRLVVFVMLGLSLGMNPLTAQSLRWLGVLDRRSIAYDVSFDGSVVVGAAPVVFYNQELDHAFYWTARTGIRDIGYGTARGVSSDGTVVVGEVYGQGFHWTESGGQQLICVRGMDVSADGSVVVGVANGRATRWAAATGCQDLGTLGGAFSYAYGVSADGAVIVGNASTTSEHTHAFRWTAATGMQDLGTLGGNYSVAYGVSADGSVVVGAAWNASAQTRAFRWTAATGMQDLGAFDPGLYTAYAVSADGSVVVGAASVSSRWRAFRWTATGGMEDLNVTYACLLLAEGCGSELLRAQAISPNGRFIVGEGYNGRTRRVEAFLLDTGRCHVEGDVNGDGVVDDADLLIVLFNFGRRCN